jgi:class 3 adenylate cyclase
VSEQERFSVGVLRVATPGVEREPIALYAGDTIRVGRVASNEIVLVDNLVSRFHAVFNASTSGIVVSDLSSLNGTFLNGRRVSTPVTLRPGDVIAIGSTRITVEPGTILRGDAEEETPSVAAAMMRTITDPLKEVVVTILVADVCSYTKISEQLPPAHVTSMLQLWFNRVSETVEEYGGEVDKYIGDCVMALWRGSRADEHGLATRAAEAALAILERTNALSAGGEWAYQESNPWSCRISLNSGEALQGTLGGSRIRDFTVLGDTVNVAFRLNDLAGKLQQDIVLSAETARLIQSAFHVNPLGSSPVEGRSGTVEIFSINAKKHPPTSDTEPRKK